MLLSFLSVYAYDFEVDGIQYDITSFTELTATAVGVSDVIEGDLTIPSTVDYMGKTLSIIRIDDNFLNGNNRITDINVCDGIASIGSNAFAACNMLKSASIPASLTTIGDHAFSHTALKEFNGCCIKRIGIGAFSECDKLERVDLPMLAIVSDSAFSACTSLSSCSAPAITEIGANAFQNCESLVSFLMPMTTEVIKEGAFMNCSGLIAFEIPNSVTTVEKDVLNGCASLEKLTIGSGVSRLPYIIFGCEKLRQVHIADSNIPLAFGVSSRTRDYYDYVYADGPSHHGTCRYYYKSPSYFKNHPIEDVYIGRNVTTYAELDYSRYESGAYLTKEYYFLPISPFYSTSIKNVEIGGQATSLPDIGAPKYEISNSSTLEGPFESCKSLSTCNIVSKVAQIPRRSFYDCSALESIALPNSVANIGISAFYNCVSLKTISLGCYLTSIGDNAFGGDDALVSISIRAPKPPTYKTGFPSSQYVSTKVSIPTGSAEEYKNAEPWKNFWNLEENTELISLFEVDGIKYLVTANNNVQIIEGSLPSNINLSLSSIVTHSGIEYNVTSIGDNAFKGCMEIESLKIEDGIESIANNAFEGCKNLREISLPGSLNTIGDGAFKNCSKLEVCNFTNPIVNIPAECFYGCSSLLDFSFEGVRSIGDSSFFNCKGLTKVVISPSVEIFGLKVFQACSNLKELIIEDSNSSIDFPCGLYDGETGVQKKEVNGKTIQFKIQYYDGYFDGLPIEKLYIGRNLLDKSRYTISGDGGVDYYLITSYDAPFSSLSKLKELEIAKGVSILGPKEEYIYEIDSYSTPGSFKNCSRIEQVTVKNEEPPTGAEFSAYTYTTAKLIVPDNTIPDYQVADGWNEFISIMDQSSAGIEVIEIDSESAFRIDSNGIVFIGDAIVPISIYSVDGRMIYKSILRSGETVSLNSGIYIIQLNNESYKIKI